MEKSASNSPPPSIRSSRNLPARPWAKQRLKSWLGSAAVLLREHLQDQHREGSVVSEGNQCQLNRGCEKANCATTTACPEAGAASAAAAAAAAIAAAGEAGEAEGVAQGEAQVAGAPADGEEVFAVGGGAGKTLSTGGASRGDRRSAEGAGMGQTCAPTAEEEGLPLPAVMTLRFLAAMDEGYVGSRREENARSKRRREEEGAG